MDFYRKEVYLWSGIPHDFQLGLFQGCVWKKCRALPRDLGLFWEGFLCFVLHSWAREISLEKDFSSEVLNLQVLFITFLNAVEEQLLQSLLNSSVDPALLLLHPLVTEQWHLWKTKKGWMLWAHLWTHIIWAATCIFLIASLKEICIPFTEMMCLGERMESEMLLFLERHKVQGYRDADVYQIALNRHANLFSSE